MELTVGIVMLVMLLPTRTKVAGIFSEMVSVDMAAPAVLLIPILSCEGIGGVYEWHPLSLVHALTCCRMGPIM